MHISAVRPHPFHYWLSQSIAPSHSHCSMFYKTNSHGCCASDDLGFSQINLKHFRIKRHTFKSLYIYQYCIMNKINNTRLFTLEHVLKNLLNLLDIFLKYWFINSTSNTMYPNNLQSQINKPVKITKYLIPLNQYYFLN